MNEHRKRNSAAWILALIEMTEQSTGNPVYFAVVVLQRVKMENDWSYS